ncbi:hypothetical protein OIU85_001200 [Salix viminalis]|uniref:ENTH domain-containing protein n=1 Tax=Salix viminalis TaxID=40686 RepID=A0A9Q0VNA4_SALVM|nr:hypothetical protein OIU85_001200 [Salix viminalis]
MSILSKSNSSNNVGPPSFHELKKQASFFFKEKIKSARLALTDVTPAELLAEEATGGNPWAPDNPTLGSISRAAFEVDDYWRIVEILHKRFSTFEKNNWRPSYNSLIVLEHLLTHGPESVAGEFQIDLDVIREMESFQCIDEKGFNWGLAARKKSGTQGILQESSNGTCARSNSRFNNSWENQFLSSREEILIETVQHKDANTESAKERPNLESWDSSINVCQVLEKPGTSLKENLTPKKEESHRWNSTGEANPLLAGRTDDPRIIEEDHPFSDAGNQTNVSLLSA